MTAKFRLRRVWVIHVSGIRLALSTEVVVPFLFNVPEVVTWIAVFLAILLVLFSIEVVSFHRRGTEIAFCKFFVLLPVRYLDLLELRLASTREDDWDPEDDQIKVYGADESVTFRCNKPDDVILWLRDKLTAVPRARMSDLRDS